MVIILILIDVFFNAKKKFSELSLSLSQSPHFLHYFIVCNLMQNEITFLRHPFNVSLRAKIHFSNVKISISITFANVMDPRKLQINIYGAVLDF